MIRPPPISPLFPSTTLSRSPRARPHAHHGTQPEALHHPRRKRPQQAEQRKAQRQAARYLLRTPAELARQRLQHGARQAQRGRHGQHGEESDGRDQPAVVDAAPLQPARRGVGEHGSLFGGWEFGRAYACGPSAALPSPAPPPAPSPSPPSSSTRHSSISACRAATRSRPTRALSSFCAVFQLCLASSRLAWPASVMCTRRLRWSSPWPMRTQPASISGLRLRVSVEASMRMRRARSEGRTGLAASTWLSSEYCVMRSPVSFRWASYTWPTLRMSWRTRWLVQPWGTARMSGFTGMAQIIAYTTVVDTIISTPPSQIGRASCRERV